ncbi:hypothetical protein ACT3SP_08535 [Brachybacterium sp. AOP43-C2-M15]|uniref:hypothetical protein n=1 Tax=Brachybacterium sp. AOP43-C2-M15 TaxID=3457661 RepID=UPI004034E888
MKRRALMTTLPAALIGTALAAPASAETRTSATSSGADCTDCANAEDNGIETDEDLYAAMDELGATSDADLEGVAQGIQSERDGDTVSPAALPIVAIGVKTLIGCALSAAWVFRDGNATANNAASRLAEVMVGCVGIPGAQWAVTKLAVLIWKYRTKIAASLSAAGLTAAQLAPLRNAKHP